MLAEPIPAPLEPLSPHDLVTYYRCPREFAWQHARHAAGRPGSADPFLSASGAPLARSPLAPPPLTGVTVTEGRLDLEAHECLVYEDEEEDGLPVLFPPERVRLDPRFRGPTATLIDPVLGLHGRPDFILQEVSGALVPVEYKATHLFSGYHNAHGRLFDTIQAIAECRLVTAAFGRRPSRALVLYGDEAGNGLHEGWVEIPYTEADERWLIGALETVRGDRVRAPVTNGRICASCAANEQGACRYAAARYEGPHHHRLPLAFGPTFG